MTTSTKIKDAQTYAQLNTEFPDWTPSVTATLSTFESLGEAVVKEHLQTATQED